MHADPALDHSHYDRASMAGPGALMVLPVEEKHVL